MAGRASGLEGAGLGIRNERELYSFSSTVIVQTLAGQVRPPHDSGKQILPPTTLADSSGDMVRIVSRRKESLLPFVSLFFLVFLFMFLSFGCDCSHLYRSVASRTSCHRCRGCARSPDTRPERISTESRGPGAAVRSMLARHGQPIHSSSCRDQCVWLCLLYTSPS